MIKPLPQNNSGKLWKTKQLTMGKKLWTVLVSLQSKDTVILSSAPILYVPLTYYAILV